MTFNKKKDLKNFFLLSIKNHLNMNKIIKKERKIIKNKI
jgi:hypothetical protein